MNNQIKSSIILIDNLLYDPKKFSRESLADKLESEELPSSSSAISRLLKYIDSQFGITIKVDRSSFLYMIDEKETVSYFLDTYRQYKSLYFRGLLNKASIENKIFNEYISFGFSTENENIKIVPKLLGAIVENRKVKLTYLPFYEKNPSDFVVTPLFIKEYLNRWYLITEKLEDRHPIFAIDRIQNYEILKNKGKRTHEINRNTFKNTVGVNFSEPVTKVKLKVSKQQYPYFKTLPFHISQKTEEEVSDGFIISFEVTLNFELNQWILFFGDSIKVLEPKTLQTQIIDNMRNNLKQYEK